MRDPDAPKPRRIVQAQPPPGPIIRPPVALRILMTCDKCFKDFEWVGYGNQVEPGPQRLCEQCINYF